MSGFSASLGGQISTVPAAFAVDTTAHTQSASNKAVGDGESKMILDKMMAGRCGALGAPFYVKDGEYGTNSR